jgi:hypothetical protein
LNYHSYVQEDTLKLFKKGCILDCRKYTVARSIVDIWNSLDEDTVSCDSLTGFKVRIVKVLLSRGFIYVSDLRPTYLLLN